MKRTEKKEKPSPDRCVCGKEAVIIRFHGKKMVSCPNPEKCTGSLRTPWLGSEDEAVLRWNTEVKSHQSIRR